MAPHDPDQNKIDVSLNIMSDATLTAVNQLTDQLSTLRQYLAAQGQSDPGQRAAGMSQAAANVAASVSSGSVQAGIFHGPSTTPVSGDLSNPSQGAQKSADANRKLRQEYEEYIASVQNGGIPTSISQPAEQMMGQHLGDWDRLKLARTEMKNPNVKNVQGVGGAMDRFYSLYQGATADPREDQTYGMVSGQYGGAMPPGIVSTADGPTGPVGGGGGGIDPNAPGWSQTLARDDITSTSRFGMTVPRLGEFTTQDKLRMAAKWLGSAAQRGQEAGDARTFGLPTGAVGRTAATASYLADNAAALTAIHRMGARARGYAGSQVAAGTNLGYSAETGINPDIAGIGMRIDLPGMSEASREGWRQELTQRRVQAAAGVTGEQAERIRATVSGMGYSGARGEDLQFNLFKRLQQRGIAPESFASNIDEGFRQGGMSVQSLASAVMSLNEAARNANMTVEQAAASTQEYSEAMQSIGANYGQSMRNASTFMTAGLDPRVASQAMQTPMVQGLLAQNTGLAPAMQGVAGPSQVMDAITQSAQLGMQGGQGFLNRPDQVTRSVTGQVVSRVTGKDQQIAYAAQATGLPRQVIERMQRNPNFLRTGGVASEMISNMENQLSEMTHGTSHRKEYGKKTGKFEGFLRKSGAINSLYKHVLDRGSGDGEDVTEDTRKELSFDQLRNLQSGSADDDVTQFDEIEAQMRAMDPSKNWQSKVTKAMKGGTPEERTSRMKKLVGEATNIQKQPQTMVGLTKEAQKLLKIVRPKGGAKDDANAGGAPANSGYQGPSYTGRGTVGPTAYGEPDHG